MKITEIKDSSYRNPVDAELNLIKSSTAKINKEKIKNYSLYTFVMVLLFISFLLDTAFCKSFTTFQIVFRLAFFIPLSCCLGYTIKRIVFYKKLGKCDFAAVKVTNCIITEVEPESTCNLGRAKIKVDDVLIDEWFPVELGVARCLSKTKTQAYFDALLWKIDNKNYGIAVKNLTNPN